MKGDHLSKPAHTDTRHTPIRQRYQPWRDVFTIILALGLSVVSIWNYGANLERLKARFLSSYTPQLGSVTWEKCPTGVDPKARCGAIIVPKDYFNQADGGIASVAFSVYRASKGPKKGTVFLNPGGPGGSGLRLAGPAYAQFIGDDWDLVGFDPRGIGRTKPTVSCFPDFLTHQLYVTNTVIEQGINVPPLANISSPFFRESLVEQYRQYLALQKGQIELCAKTMGDELRYMGTANVVRDMDFMATAFDGEDAKINFHGGSYGSVLGTWLVNMLPDRVGYVVIDGIVDPISWSTDPVYKWASNWLASSEETYEIFLKDCSEAGPSLCPLAQHENEPTADIEERIEAFLDDLSVNPLPVPHARRPGVLTSGSVRGLILYYLMRPMVWPLAASNLHAAMQGNGTSLYDFLMPDYAAQTTGILPITDLQRSAVSCADARPPVPGSQEDFPSPEDLADHGIRTLKGVSRHFGVSVSVVEKDGECQYWPVRAPERFAGPWNAKLERPMLVVSAKSDPVTPLRSAVLVNSLMGNSTSLVIQEGPGHCSTGLPTLCVAKLKRAYFAGETPANGTFCKQELRTFPSAGAGMLDADLEASMTEDDRALLEALRQVPRLQGDIPQGMDQF
ncbi:unnamed protein product [Cyclocybe aegerita]|uniref:Alpha/beta-hydrolase n=1 Tax=Cyclocybe aegerita TaxID=1973307 RepID=A0A8S0WBP1_CYCAE|nr:unnamed protein product [Cyclocybe aegerita]